ncbi:bifunctional nicotinamidase/pyrazinamidase [Pseudomonas sp. SWRI154]|uniref:bifunctional nicotinamidase/pyrazinamidase n=1 Tax=Pseudomonas sp. SWRI154 TaxID=2745501 RepID=UPI0016457594|nr:bifunctional nicotinamidase/pyrazinamidase [Pseudomonas sp. SWRI154]MBC3366387.1 bifunctional nicotinamidase/pyrazinamidase [Pseudomonas sp. SWRI154]
MPTTDSKSTNTALLVIDIQNDFTPGGQLAVPGGDEIVPLVNQLGRTFRHIVVAQDWHPAGHASFASSHAGKQPFDIIQLPYGEQKLWPDHCVEGTPGAALHPALDLPHAQLIIRKGCNPAIDSYSAFMEADRQTPTGLTGYLKERGIDTVYMVGLALDFCVMYSALDARMAGFNAIVLLDACRGIDIDGSMDTAIRRMQEAGVKLIQSSDIANPALA